MRYSLLALSALVLSACSNPPPASQTATPAQGWDKEVAQYRAFVIDQVDSLLSSTKDFTAAVDAGDFEKAKALYPVARSYYERIEPIAEAIGDLDPDIDARIKDVPKIEDWRGFHRIEKALWADKNLKDQGQFTKRLLDDVKLLRAKVETVEIGIDHLVTGATELLNEVSTSKITGEEELYSHTDLYDFVANVEGSEKIFSVLKDRIQGVDGKLAQTLQDRFAQLDAALAPYKKGEGYVDYRTLTPDQTKQLSQAVDALAEPLSEIGKIVKGAS